MYKSRKLQNMHISAPDLHTSVLLHISAQDLHTFLFIASWQRKRGYAPDSYRYIPSFNITWGSATDT